MASSRRESFPARAGAAVLAWGLFAGAWLVLGMLGRSTSPLWFSGLAPVAAWLAVVGAIPAFGGHRRPSGGLLCAAGVVTVVASGWCVSSGNGGAAFLAAIGWGVLSCGASRHAEDVGLAFVPGCVVAESRRRPVPVGWISLGARWAMLPMMVGWIVSSDWCAGLGLSVAQGAVLHLAAMLAPVLLLRACRVPAWVAAFMGAGLLALPLWPGARGWMLMSLLHAVAWGLAATQASVARPARAPRSGDDDRGSGTALVPAVGVLALGALVAARGPAGLVAVHVACGLVSLAGTLAWALSNTAGRARTGHEESLT